MRLVSFSALHRFSRHGRFASPGGLARSPLIVGVALGVLIGVSGIAVAPVLAAQPVDRPAVGIERPVEAETLRRALSEAETPEDAERVRRRLEILRLRSDSATADLLTARAGAARAGGEVGLALDLLDAAIAVAPNWGAGRRLRGLVHVEREAFGPAATDLEDAIRRDPSDATALFVLAALRERDGDAAAALDLARRAQGADPYLPGLAETIERLTLDVEGRPL